MLILLFPDKCASSGLVRQTARYSIYSIFIIQYVIPLHRSHANTEEAAKVECFSTRSLIYYIFPCPISPTHECVGASSSSARWKKKKGRYKSTHTYTHTNSCLSPSNQQEHRQYQWQCICMELHTSEYASYPISLIGVPSVPPKRGPGPKQPEAKNARSDIIITVRVAANQNQSAVCVFRVVAIAPHWRLLSFISVFRNAGVTCRSTLSLGRHSRCRLRLPRHLRHHWH